MRPPRVADRDDRPAGSATSWLRAGILLAWCMTLGIGVAVLHAPPLRTLGAGVAFWAWMFGASGCGKLLALAAQGRWAGLPLWRMLCAVIGLVSWSQLSWLFLQGATAAAAIGGLVVYAAVALAELHAIYRAARDARSDDP